MRIPVVSTITSLIPAVERALARRGLPPVELVPMSRSACEDGEEAWSGARIALADPGQVAGAPLRTAASLEWLQSTWAGVNALAGDGPYAFRCTKVSGCFGPLVAEHVFAYVLADARRLDAMRAAQRDARWAHAEFAETAMPLAGQTLGVLGGGDIGRHVAGVAKAFGLKTLAFARDGGGPRRNFDETTSDLDEVLRRGDVLVSALPSTPETRGLLDGRFQRCERRPLFFNVGRGDVVAEAEILRALEAGFLRGAVLDVFADEPLAATSPLWRHACVTVTPHVAALSRPDDVADVFARNLERFLEGGDLLYGVDWGKGY